MAGLIKKELENEPGEGPDHEKAEGPAFEAKEDVTEGEAPGSEDAQQPAQGGRQVGAQSIREQMQVPPELQDTYQRLVMAAKKILFSPQMDGPIQELLQGEGALGDKIAQGVFALVGMLMDKARGAVPPPLVIPLAVEMVGEAADFLEETGVNVSDKDTAAGMAAVIQMILEKAGVSMDQLPGMFGGAATPSDRQQGLIAGQAGQPPAAPPPVAADGQVKEPV